MEINEILSEYRINSTSERGKGDKFERLMQSYLLTDPLYANQFQKVWLWNEFPSRTEFGGKDIGIDLVAYTNDKDYWAIQCKFYAEDKRISKDDVDSFLSTSGKSFTVKVNEKEEKVNFTKRLFISTTNNWGATARETLENQTPQVSILNFNNLMEANVDWKKLNNGIFGEQAKGIKKELRQHQKEALEKTEEYFESKDRGQLIMACGTGKTFTSLKIAEKETNGEGLILFLVPSIALLGQTLREWSNDAEEAINAICICSDPKSSRKTSKNSDNDGTSVIDLALPASTNIDNITKQLENIKNKKGLKVVFSTYQSINVIAEAQNKFLETNGDDFGIFDLIICDEAHRTTGVTLAGNDESAFVRVHDNDFIISKKRLYMTATPRLYGETSKIKANENDHLLCSMDDELIYGNEIYRIGFGRAVEEGLLCDYKVLILTLSEKDIPLSVQRSLAGDSKEISMDDAAKLAGCINALSKQILGDGGILRLEDFEKMKKALAFCSTIKNSKEVTNVLNRANSEYIGTLDKIAQSQMVKISSKHIDGSMNAPQRDELVNWLKSDSDDKDECKILTNVRCLSEGVDVPSLDAVLFISAKNSEIEVVQSVGRVMRTSKSTEKKYGYIIIPVFIPSDIDPAVALNDNKKYAVVWTVLNALRAHDDRFNSTINQMQFNKNKPKNIIIGTPDNTGKPTIDFNGTQNIGEQFALKFEELQGHIYAKMVDKVGDRHYWKNWAKDIATVAENQIARINNLIKTNKKHRNKFDKFIDGLQKNISPEINEQQAIEMLSQHIITKPVFEALFEDYSFVKNNAISKSMQKMLDLLEDEGINSDATLLDEFYKSVKDRVSKLDNGEAKQKVIVELYDKFFKSAFPKLVEKLGIVYTPIEVVDFIIYSVEDVLKKEFGRSLSDEGVNILDPFTGTGTFITRLLQSRIIKTEDLERKYKHEIFANEIILLAYYIAAVNIENTYHDLQERNNKKYVPFDGICLTDTFQMGEDGGNETFSEMFPQNSERVSKLKKIPLTVIIGNPPYSIGQKSENDNAKNQEYPILNEKIADTYVKNSNSKMNKALYDAYIKAFRWSTDRLDKNGGIISFVTNSGWVDGKATSGFRKTLEKEFSTIYILNLRGSVKAKIGENAKKEGQSIFNILVGVSIIILVKNPKVETEKAKIYYNDIGDYLSREEKLKIIKDYKTVTNSKLNFKILSPNSNGDWINQRSDIFDTFIPLIDKNDKINKNTFFNISSNGIVTNRDSWVYSFSKKQLIVQMKKTIEFYNSEIENYRKEINKNSNLSLEDIIDTNPQNISWTRSLKNSLKNPNSDKFLEENINISAYRPFTKEHFYFTRKWNECVYQQPKLFPNSKSTNKVIFMTGTGNRRDFSRLISENIVDLNSMEAGAQCLPLHYYEVADKGNLFLFDESPKLDLIKKDGITDWILERAQELHGKRITKEQIFYYVYGFLHNKEYCEKFSSDLKKMIPRIPLIANTDNFLAYVKAGQELAELHINYETIPAYKGCLVKGEEENYFKVKKIKFDDKKCKSTIIFNSKITISNIPLEAYDYVINGRSAIEWILDRYKIRTDKDSGIINDPNDWAIESGNERYILDLLLSIIEVSLRTMEIVKGLPRVNFDE